MGVLKKEKLYAKFEFSLERVVSFKHVVTARGIEVDPSKVMIVLNWSRPANVREICRLLGLAGYYRRFVEGFSDITGPLTQLTHKNAKFDWTEKFEYSFEELK